MYLFWFTRCVNQPCLVVALALGYKFMVIIAILNYTKSSVKRLRIFFAYRITFSYFINLIAMELLLNVIPLFCSRSSEIRFELDPRVSATSCNSMLLLFVNGIKTMPISTISITYLATVTNSMLFVPRLWNSFWLLQRWQTALKSKD